MPHPESPRRHDKPANVHRPVCKLLPGHDARQPCLVKGTEEPLTASAKLIECFAQRRDAVKTDQLGLDGVPGSLTGKYGGRRVAISNVQFTYRTTFCHVSRVYHVLFR